MLYGRVARPIQRAVVTPLCPRDKGDLHGATPTHEVDCCRRRNALLVGIDLKSATSGGSLLFEDGLTLGAHARNAFLLSVVGERVETASSARHRC